MILFPVNPTCVVYFYAHGALCTYHFFFFFFFFFFSFLPVPPPSDLVSDQFEPSHKIISKSQRDSVHYCSPPYTANPCGNLPLQYCFKTIFPAVQRLPPPPTRYSDSHFSGPFLTNKHTHTHQGGMDKIIDTGKQ